MEEFKFLQLGVSPALEVLEPLEGGKQFRELRARARVVIWRVVLPVVFQSAPLAQAASSVALETLVTPEFSVAGNSLLSSVAACQSVLAENPAAFPAVDACAEKLAGLLASDVPERVPLPNKDRTVAVLRTATNEVVAATAALSDPGAGRDVPLRSALLTIEGHLRALELRIAALSGWSGDAVLGLRNVHSRARGNALATRVEAGTILDFGSWFDSEVRISGVGDRMEADGYRLLPAEDAVLISIPRLWLRWKRFSRLQFKIGRFPDQADPGPSVDGPEGLLGARALESASYSLQTWLSVVEAPVRTAIRVRSDVNGIHVFDLHRPTPALIERNLVALDADAALLQMGRYDLNFETRFGLHWFSDLDGLLGANVIGRPRTEGELPPLAPGASFRVWDWRVAVALTPVRELPHEGAARSSAARIDARFWRNNLQASSNVGWLAGTALQIDSRFFPVEPGLDWMFGLRVEAGSAGRASAPPSLLDSRLAPGISMIASSARLETSLGQGRSLSLLARWTRERPRSQDGAAARIAALLAVRPLWSASLEYRSASSGPLAH